MLGEDGTSQAQKLLDRRNAKLELKLSIATKSKLILQDPQSNVIF